MVAVADPEVGELGGGAVDEPRRLVDDAMLESLEGRRGEIRVRPPLPAENPSAPPPPAPPPASPAARMRCTTAIPT